VRVGQSQRLDAASRLVQGTHTERRAAARRLLERGAEFGIDDSLIWATLDGSGKPSEVCLAVPGSGRTATVFLSIPRESPESSQAVRERAGALDAACRWLASQHPSPVSIAQHLPEPGDRWAIDACELAGFTMISTLSYLARPNGPVVAPSDPPAGIRFESFASLDDLDEGDRLLCDVLDASYRSTLDCPELCGLRRTEDVIDSHRAVGVWDPSTWWLVFEDRQPLGCALFNPCPTQHTIELVYLGLRPEIRGRGIGKALLAHALRAVSKRPERRVTCAVDDRNSPAMSLYHSVGFAPFAHRAALVLPLASDR